MANALIAHNNDRVPRQLIPKPENGPGEVVIVQYDALANEAAGIANFVADLIENQGYEPRDILILAQRRSIGNPIYQALAGRNIPTKSYYQESAVDNVAAQERLALLKLLIDPNDRIALRWLLGFGSNDFRKNAYHRLREHCEAASVEPWDAMVQMRKGELKIPHTKHLVERFREIEQELEALRVVENFAEFIPVWLQEEFDEEDLFRKLVLDLSLEADFPADLLSALIEAVSLPDIPPDVTDVRIMSLHKSKGLSSPVVIIAGCVEGLLPPAPDEDLSAAEIEVELEEQRRLFFVGLTRVKAQPDEGKPGVLRITSSRTMSLADAKQSGISPARVVYGIVHLHASRFIQELGPAAPRTIRG